MINTSDSRQLIGEFVIDSGSILVTDPCYDTEELQLIIPNVRNGLWKGHVYRKIDKRALKFRDEKIANLETLKINREKLAESNKNGSDFFNADPELASLMKKAIESIEESIEFNNIEIEKLKNYDCGRVSILAAFHETVDLEAKNSWLYASSVGVDSGQMSISDFGFAKEHPLHQGGHGEFVDGKFTRDMTGAYWQICELTKERFGAGIFKNHAIASQSGWGDGEYDVFVMTNNGSVCGVAIKFIDEEDVDEP